MSQKAMANYLTGCGQVSKPVNLLLLTSCRALPTCLEQAYKDSGRVLLATVIFAAIAGFAIALAYLSLAGKGVLGSDFQTLGQVGDFFGGILNPVFSFITVVALVLTLLLQSKELKMSREEVGAMQERTSKVS